MVSKALKEKLEKQQYGFAGEHSAVKICNWTKKSLRDEDVCYKQKFYGIQSHRCAQMSPAVGFCQNTCIFCWRELELSEGFGDIVPSKTIKKIDDPKDIIEGCIKQQRKLLTGFGGNDKANMHKFKEAQNPTQWAISLTGEPTLYPKLSELIKELKNRGNSTFLVTNGLLPDTLKEMEMPTQLYVSLDAPNKEIFNQVDRSKVKDAWNKLMQTMDVLKELKNKTRTTIRITLLKGLNMVNPEGYAEILKKAQPKFIEVKGYMFIGSSRQRLTIENMPRHFEVKEFAQKICDHCDYKIIDEKEESNVVLLGLENYSDRIIQN